MNTANHKQYAFLITGNYGYEIYKAIPLYEKSGLIKSDKHYETYAEAYRAASSHIDNIK